MTMIGEMPPKQKVYYAHPMSMYNTEAEAADLALIAKILPGAEIINPNQPRHQEGCKSIGMAYFTELVKSCDAIVGVPFDDGEWGAGVYAEMEQMGKMRGPVYELARTKQDILPINYRTIRPLSIQETSDRVHGRK